MARGKFPPGQFLFRVASGRRRVADVDIPRGCVVEVALYRCGIAYQAPAGRVGVDFVRRNDDDVKVPVLLLQRQVFVVGDECRQL